MSVFNVFWNSSHKNTKLSTFDAEPCYNATNGDTCLQLYPTRGDRLLGIDLHSQAELSYSEDVLICEDVHASSLQGIFSIRQNSIGIVGIVRILYMEDWRSNMKSKYIALTSIYVRWEKYRRVMGVRFWVRFESGLLWELFSDISPAA